MQLKETLELTQELSILYVEDDDQLRLATTNLFQSLFKSVDSAANGEEGLKLFEQGSYDIIISDILMPRMNGLEMAKQIKSKKPQQQIIIISAYNDASYFEQSIHIGVDGYIIKPIHNEQLFQVLEKIARKIKLTKENIAYQEGLEAEVKSRTLAFKNALVTDRLTQLPNRLALEHDLDPDEEYQALLFNIDNFNSINIGLGYETGDAVLTSVAKLLQTELNGNDKWYRIGADEFLYVCQQCGIAGLKEYAQHIQDKFLRQAIALPFNQTIKLTLSAAIATGRASVIVRNVELALYEARKQGKSKLFIYQDDLPIFNTQKERINWINRLKKALDHDEIVPFFQPIISNVSHEINKYEALARIVSYGEIITPNYFIEPARLSGQISEVTKTMIRKIFEQMQHFDYEFSINIESEDLSANYLPDYIKHYAQKYHIRMDRIVVEVLENIHTFDVKNILNQLTELKNMGIKIAIDDFGTEQSNFSRLLDIQADYIKIDGQFIKDIDSDSKSFKICSAITQMAKNLDAKVIAEFVHNQAVQHKILELGIDFSQGYYLGQPEPKIK